MREDARRPDAAGDEAAALRVLAEVVAGTADLAAAVRDINRLIAITFGVRVVHCALVSPQLRAATGAASPTSDELAAVGTWRAALRHGAHAALEPHQTADAVLVPVVHRRRVHGALRVEPMLPGEDVPPDASSLLTAIGLGCGEVVWKAGVRRDLARSRRRLAIAVEQERTARDAQASLHRRLATLGDLLAAHIADAPDRVWRNRMQELLLLTGEADREVRQSLNFLRSLPARRDDLPESLRLLAREVTAATDLNVKLYFEGEPRRLSVTRVEALFHVAVEALLGAALGARANSAVVMVEYHQGEVRLEVRDDGVGLAHRSIFATAASDGLRGAQQRVNRVGGQLRLYGMRPRGVVVDATVPTRSGR
jgi:NarL family two-component system sensor histidine kinase YdfH